MAAKVQAKRLIAEYLLQTGSCTRSASDIDFYFGSLDSLPNLNKLLREIELWEVFDYSTLLLEYYRGCEQKGEVQGLLENLEAALQRLQVTIMILDVVFLIIDDFSHSLLHLQTAVK